MKWVSDHATLVLTILFVILFVVAIWSDRQRLNYAERQRQKKLDQQNNIGRRIRNFLENRARDLHASLLNFDVVEGDGYEVLTQVSVTSPNPHDCVFEKVVVLRIWIDMFDPEQARWKTPIRVLRQDQLFHEQWPADEHRLEALIKNLDVYITSRHPMYMPRGGDV